MIKFIDGQMWISVSQWRNLPKPEVKLKTKPAIENFNLEQEMRKAVREVLEGLSPKDIKMLSRMFKYGPNQ